MMSVLVGGGGSRGGLLNRAEQMSFSDTIALVAPPNTEQHPLTVQLPSLSATWSDPHQTQAYICIVFNQIELFEEF